MDFFDVQERTTTKGGIEVFADFVVDETQDLMIRGKKFFAVWDKTQNLWTTNEFKAQRLIDKELMAYKEQMPYPQGVYVKTMRSNSSGGWLEFQKYITRMPDIYHDLDRNLTFADQKTERDTYASKRLSYSLDPDGDYSSWDEMVGTLYAPDERTKLEWAIGSVLAGDSKTIQKFVVLYGSAGTGKSTVLNIIHDLFEGYTSSFEAESLVGNNNVFGTEAFKENPLVAIQHDGDLSKIEHNTKLNSIVSHESMTINEKFKATYTSTIDTFLFMGTNSPVKITDSKSGIVRRLIDISPTGNRIAAKRYQTLMGQIKFQLGAIASHCLERYLSLGKHYYDGYRPIEMMLQTDHFYNFIEDSYHIFAHEDGVSLKRAYALYKQFCVDAGLQYPMNRMKFRDELRSYFNNFTDRAVVNGVREYSYYSGFKSEKFKSVLDDESEQKPMSLSLEETESIFDKEFANSPAQYSSEAGTPQKYWDNHERTSKGKKFTPTPDQVVQTKLSDLDTSREHYVKLPVNHIVIDFDLKDDSGEKSAEKNLSAASEWPPTYSEFSKSGKGIHLHYWYSGDTSQLSRIFSDGIEIKVFTGNSSLRRKLSLCNNLPIATLSGGLPIKEKKMLDFEQVQTEKGLRSLIERNLNKSIHPGTKPSMDFIHKILEDAYDSKLTYDVTDMRPRVLNFAMGSTHQSEYCLELLNTMKFKSEEISDGSTHYDSDRLAFFDTECFPNIFHISWKYQGNGTMVHMTNPTPADIEEFLKLKLVGFNCRKYDNHMLYAVYMGYNNRQLFDLSQRLINGSKNSMFGEAYNLSYTDIYDFASSGNKKSLKKWEIELGIHHQELGLPWDEDIPEDMIQKMIEYCDNDVLATEAVFNHLQGDWVAREILADLSGLTPNHTTNQHTTKIIFGDDKHPQPNFLYTELATGVVR